MPQTPRNDFNDLRAHFPHFPQTTRRNDFNDLAVGLPALSAPYFTLQNRIPPSIERDRMPHPFR